jgi:hypothetical protein
MHRYKLRPGYGSKELLLEFGFLDDYHPFADDLFYAMQQGGFVAAKGWNMFGFLGGKCTAADLTFCSTVFFHSRHGALSISMDEWDGIFGFGVGKNGQSALIHADRSLRASGRFEALAVDFAEYENALPEQEETGSRINPPEEPPLYRLRLIWRHMTSMLKAVAAVGREWCRRKL